MISVTAGKPDSAVRCAGCGRALSEDEIALTKKLINRGAVSFYCLSCLGARLQVTEAILRRKIQEFRAMGCTLFPAKAEESE